MTTGCQIIIGDGLRGTDDVEVPVKNGEYCKTASIGRAIMDADVFISLTHFKGHEMHGLWRRDQEHRHGLRQPRRQDGPAQRAASPPWTPRLCRGCRRCAKECGSDAISYVNNKAVIDYDKCKGCGRCIGACTFDAISSPDDTANEMLDRKMAEYAQAVLPRTAPASTSPWCRTSAPTATATARTTRPSCRMWACSPASTPWPWTRPAPTPA